MFLTILFILVLDASAVWIKHQSPISDYLDGYCMATTTQHLIVFGGRNPTTNSVSSNLVIMKQQNGTFNKIFEMSAPIARFGCCCCVHLSYFYVYGGKNEQNAQSNELWRYDLNSSSWSRIVLQNNTASRSSCVLLFENHHLIILGAPSNHLQINLITQAVQPYPLRRVQFTQLTNTLWDNTTQTIQLSGQHDLEGAVKIYVNAIQPLTNPKITTVQPNTHLILSQQGQFILKNQTITKISNVSLPCLPITLTAESYIFLICQDILKVMIYPQMKIQSVAVDDIAWPGNLTHIVIANISDDIVVVGTNDTTLTVFQLKKQSCQMTPNLQQCWYGWSICSSGFTGSDCMTPLCPNGIVLYDKHSFSSLVYQCSDSGQCKNGICLCSNGRNGDDCSGNSKPSCLGTIITDYPLDICQCQSTTLGGINCDVEFCYNDCCDNTCSKEFGCMCPTDYTGADCSIFIIKMQFSHAYKLVSSLVFVFLILY